MRISSDPDDPGFHLNFSYCRIWLEGAERSNVITADEGKRFAITIRLDEWGMPVKGKDGKAVLDKFYGAVRIDCAPWLREAMEQPQEEPDTLSAAIYGMIAVP